MASRPAVVVERALRSPTASIAYSANAVFQKKLLIIQVAPTSILLRGVVQLLSNEPAAALSVTRHWSALRQ